MEKEKLLDFGVFGEFSEKTLLANSVWDKTWGVGKYPFNTSEQHGELVKKLNKLRNKKVRGSYTKVFGIMKDIKGLEKNLEDFNRLESEIRKLHKRAKKGR